MRYDNKNKIEGNWRINVHIGNYALYFCVITSWISRLILGNNLIAQIDVPNVHEFVCFTSLQASTYPNTCCSYI